MGNPKVRWTAEEEEGLRQGIAKHGPGKWKQIQKDPDFNHILSARSNIDLKDKWRNWNVNKAVQGKEVHNDKKTAPDANDKKIVPDVKDQSNNWILDAISSLKDPNGSDSGSIIRYIEGNYEVPANFQRTLPTKLNKLVDEGKIEKGPNGYRMKKSINVSPQPKRPISLPVVPERVPVPTAIHKVTLEEAASDAAYRIAEAENKTFLAYEAVKEADRVSKLAEECESKLFLAKEILERCCRGEIVIIRDRVI